MAFLFDLSYVRYVQSIFFHDEIQAILLCRLILQTYFYESLK